MRLIDGDNLARWLQMVLANENPLDRKARAAFSDVLARVNTMPVVDAVPVVHGRWIYGVTLNHEWRKCSECLVSQEIFGCFTYCPNCGARMDGDTP